VVLGSVKGLEQERWLGSNFRIAVKKLVARFVPWRQSELKETSSFFFVL
jgi:hypothetical protein